MVVRPSAVAGQFYPRDADRLRKQVSDLLANIAMPIKNIPKALIVPHAGYVYSGATAAAAFATLRDGAQTITRVVLIGPAHYVHVRGIAAPTVDAFETPLGRVPVDKSALNAIAGLPFVIQDDLAHAPEHALEVELPFLQTLLVSFQVVPLLVGDATPEEIAQMMLQLWESPGTLIVVSTDLSHYHNYETARRLGCRDCCGHRAWRLASPHQACGSRGCSWSAAGNGTPWPKDPATLIVQLRRHGRLSRSGREIWSLDVCANGSVNH
jgi:AmmeMemoRadiSam system protein B